MDRCLNREAALERVRAKAEQTEDELGQLHKWKSTMEKKFDLLEQARKELEQRTEEAGKALEAKEKEVQDLKEQLRQAKELRSVNTVIPTLCWESWGDRSFKALMMHSVNLRKPTLNWTCQ